MPEYLQSTKPYVHYLDFLIADGNVRRNFKQSLPDSLSPLATFANIDKWVNWCTAFLNLFGPDDEFNNAFLQTIEVAKGNYLWPNFVKTLIEILEAKKSDVLADPPDINELINTNIGKQPHFTSIKPVNLNDLNSLILKGNNLAQRGAAYDFDYGRLIWENPLIYKKNIPMFKRSIEKRWLVPCRHFLTKYFGKNSGYYRTFEEKERIASLYLYLFGAGIRSLEEIRRKKKESTMAERAHFLISEGNSIFSNKPIDGYLMEGKVRSTLWYIKKAGLTKREQQKLNKWESNYKAFLKDVPTVGLEFDCSLEEDLQGEYKNVLCVDQVIEVLKDVKIGCLWSEIIKDYNANKSEINNSKDVSEKKQCLSETASKNNQALPIPAPSSACYGELHIEDKQAVLKLFMNKAGPGKRRQLCSPIKLGGQAYRILKAGFVNAHQSCRTTIRETAVKDGLSFSRSECEPAPERKYTLCWSQNELASIVHNITQFCLLPKEQKASIKTAVSRLRNLVRFSDGVGLVTEPDSTKTRHTTIQLRNREWG